jgi:predicted Zn-dependent protease
VPLEVTVLRSEEINAFAVPGGFLFINTGLLEKAGNEAELAGVMAHEIAHIAARHGKRLMTKAQIANIAFQAAQLAAMIFTGGISSIASYYLFQYGFLGLGLVLNLTLLGVNRDFEIEADILGAQYLWKANYHTGGFIDFFERMAKEEGYIKGLSWFRTHPPFAERMTQTFEEIKILPTQEEPRMDSTRFQEMQQRLTEILTEKKEIDKNAPTLRRVYDCDDVELNDIDIGQP